MDTESTISPSARAKIRIRIKGIDYRMVDQCASDIVASVTPTGARISGPFPLPSQVEVYRAADQDEVRGHRRNIEIINSSAQTVDVMRRINLPAGIENRSYQIRLPPPRSVTAATTTASWPCNSSAPGKCSAMQTWSPRYSIFSPNAKSRATTIPSRRN
jgi:small subunit ribosomal protein S10